MWRFTLITANDFVAQFKYYSGPEAQQFASIRYPPMFYIEFGNSGKTLNFSHLDFNWDLFYSYVHTKMKDMILEVRP